MNKLHIAIDLQSCQSGSRLGGIGRYSVELAKAMILRGAQHKFSLLLNDVNPIGEASVRAELSNFLPPDSIRVFSVPRGICELNNHSAKVRSAELIREQFIYDIAPDVLHISSLFEGLQEEIVTSVGQIYPGINTAVTLYDLIPLIQKEKYLANKRALEHYMRKVNYIKESGLLLAISEYSRQEACDVLGISESKIVNISSAADSKFKPMHLTEIKKNTLKQRYGIRDRFLMYTGSFDQRKNHANLIRAYALLPASVRSEYQLVIVGNGWDAIYNQLHDVARQAGVESERVVFSGHVADSDLVPLYNLCDLFVFPSLAEGFGLPVLEAMSCGTPTICSNTTSLPEVIGLKEAMFDPTSPKSIAALLHRSLTDQAFRFHLKEHGLNQSKKFSWDESARRALEAFEMHSARNNVKANVKQFDSNLINLDLFAKKFRSVDEVQIIPDGALREFAECLARNQQLLSDVRHLESNERSVSRIGWVTTWNTRCGIAAYSKFLIDEWPAQYRIFAPYADWTTVDDAEPVVRCWKSGGGDDLSCLLNMIVEYNADAVIIQFNYSFFEFTAFVRLVDQLTARGIRVIVTFHSTHDPSQSKRLVSLAATLYRCAALVVHTLRDVNVLEKIGLKDNVVLLPQGVRQFKDLQSVRNEDDGHFTIATYGFALPHKGLQQMVHALSILRSEGGGDYRLIMINARYPDPQSAQTISAVEELVEKNNLKEFVTIVTDYLSDEQSIEYLRRSDAVVFAYQGTGESSSAAVRMGLASGRPVLVTPVHIFDDVRECVHTLPGIDPEEISRGIRDFFLRMNADKALLDGVEKSARLWRSAHSFNNIAKELFLLCRKSVRKNIEYKIRPQFDISGIQKILTFSPIELPMRTAVGVVRESILVSSLRSGYLLFGPFIGAAPGTYRANIIGTMTGGVVKMDVCANSGSTILGERVMKSTDDSIQFVDLDFIVPDDGVVDLELRLEVDGAVDVKVAEVRFEYVGRGKEAT